MLPASVKVFIPELQDCCSSALTTGSGTGTRNGKSLSTRVYHYSRGNKTVKVTGLIRHGTEKNKSIGRGKVKLYHLGNRFTYSGSWEGPVLEVGELLTDFFYLTGRELIFQDQIHKVVQFRSDGKTGVCTHAAIRISSLDIYFPLLPCGTQFFVVPDGTEYGFVFHSSNFPVFQLVPGFCVAEIFFEKTSDFAGKELLVTTSISKGRTTKTTRRTWDPRIPDLVEEFQHTESASSTFIQMNPAVFVPLARGRME